MNVKRKRIPCGFVASSSQLCSSLSVVATQFEFLPIDGEITEEIANLSSKFDPLESVLERQLQSITKIPHEDRGARIHPIMRGEEGHHLDIFHQVDKKSFLPVDIGAQCKLTLARYKKLLSLPDYNCLVARLG
jgi:hypothetical protein